MTVSADTSYVLDYHLTETFDLSNLIYIIAENYDLDVDRLLDICQHQGRDVSRSINQIVLNVISKLNVYDRSKLFYQFVHKQLETINALIKHLVTDLPEVTLSSVINHESFINWKRTFKETYILLKLNVNFSFNDIIKTEYLRLQESNDRALIRANFYYSRTVDKSNRFTSTRTYGGASNTQTHMISNVNVQTTTSTYRNANNWFGSDTNMQWENLLDASGYVPIPSRYHRSEEARRAQSEQILLRNRYPAKIDISDKAKSRLKKSFKGLTKFLRKDEYEDLFIHNDLVIEGKSWNFRISFHKRKDIITYSEHIDNFSIPYNLELLTKSNEFICTICIVYPGCPILDEILSTILLIKSGQEDVIINTGNHMRKSGIYRQFFKGETISASEGARIEALVESLNIVKDLVRLSLRSILDDGEEIDYIMSVDTSWSEIIGYQAFNLFDVKVFDKYVKPLTWVPKTDKFNLLEQKEKLILEKSNGKNNVSKLPW